MAKTIIGIISILLPLIFIILILWGESDFKWRGVLAYFALLGVPALLILFYNPFSNLTDWQIGVFGVIFALAIVGVHHLSERGK